MARAQALSVRILTARKQVGLTQEGLAEAVGVSVSSVAQYETGKILPRIPTLERIASVTKKPLEWFFSSGSESTAPPPGTKGGSVPDEAALRRMVREEVRRAIASLASKRDLQQAVSAVGNALLPAPTSAVPVYEDVPAGSPIEARPVEQDAVELPRRWVSGRGEVYCIRARGQSMEPLIKDGDILAVQRQSDADAGAIVIVTVGGLSESGDFAVKKLERKGNQVVFRSLNRAYRDLQADEQTAIEGVVIGLLRELRV